MERAGDWGVEGEGVGGGRDDGGGVERRGHVSMSNLEETGGERTIEHVFADVHGRVCVDLRLWTMKRGGVTEGRRRWAVVWGDVAG